MWASACNRVFLFRHRPTNRVETMQKLIKNEIKKISYKKINKAQSKAKKLEEYSQKFTKCTGLRNFGPSFIRPPSKDWFDPKYCARHANAISKIIWMQLEIGTYLPQPARRFAIPKKGGGFRDITEFSIPDAAISKIIYSGIVRRNLKKFSSSSYAYMPDRNVFDALLSLDDFDRRSKVFVTQVDFEKFFDKIPHEYLSKLINSNVFHTTTLEKRVLKSFMTHDSYEVLGGASKALPKRSVGTPQGSSISLILSNLANHELDRELSLLSGKFVRYADDVVALSTTYEQALAIEHAFYWHCEQNGLSVNKGKSPGISAFSDESQEIRTTKFVDFLGYRLTFAGTGISPAVEARFRQKVAKLINIYLVQYQKINFNPSRASSGPISFDWDLLGLVSELRRSIYGGLREHDIVQALQKGKKLSKMKGIMSHYSLLDDGLALKRLDGWTLNSVRRAMVQRLIIIRKFGGRCPTPSCKQLLSGDWLNPKAWDEKEGEETEMPEVEFPSFVKAWKAARKQIVHHGVGSAESDLNSSDEDLVDLFDYP